MQIHASIQIMNIMPPPSSPLLFHFFPDTYCTPSLFHLIPTRPEGLYLSPLYPNFILPFILSSPTASKESSFIYAIISATLTHTLTGACKDEIIDCESQTATGITVNQTHSVTSDLHNVTYSALLAEEFLDSIENGGKSLSDRQHLNLHNNRLGRMVTYTNINN